MSSSTEAIQLAALAGLLHDIGKFWQRGATDFIHPDYKHFGKQDYGVNGAHATFSAAFVQEYVPERWAQAVTNGILWHHHPQAADARLVALADRLSAGVDRERSEELQNPMQLLSIFGRLEGAIGDSYLPLRPLALDEAVLMPSVRSLPDADAKKAYAAMWSAFTNEVELLRQIPDLTAYLEALMGLLQRYTWCIPSAYYGSQPDISLYDHSRTTAALSACLSHLPDEQLERLLKQRDNQPLITFVEGDLSGIQRFLYTIPARGATKQLRARSLYLQSLTDAAVRWLLRQWEMPPLNIIYSGGGRFFALLPYTTDSDTWLAGAQQTLDRLLLKHHDGDLAISLGWSHLSAADFSEPDQFAQRWHEVTAATGTAKRARYANFTAEELNNSVFEARMHSENDELWLRRSERDEAADDDDERRSASALGRSFEDFSRKLAHSDYLLLATLPEQDPDPGGMENLLTELGVAVLPLDANELNHQWRETLPTNAEYALLQGLHDLPDHGDRAFVERVLGCPVASTLRYTVNVTAMINNGHQPATFDRLQEAAATSGAIKRLGVLRMDVDDLGQLFAAGFQDPKTHQSRASLARVASLSFSLSLFFEGWVGELCEQINQTYITELKSDERGHFDRVEAVYAVYSGGDDLFIVGRWDVLPELAYRIRTDLERYAGGNPKVHISAGITLHSGKYPLYQAAEEAKEALEEAKSITGKDSITFLGQSLKWSDWQTLLDVRDELKMLIAVNKAPRAILQSLLNLHDEYSDALRKSKENKAGETQLVWGPWQWRSAYQFARLAERSRDNREAIEGLYSRLRKSNFASIITIGLAARWVEALTRTREKGREHVE